MPDGAGKRHPLSIALKGRYFEHFVYQMSVSNARDTSTLDLNRPAQKPLGQSGSWVRADGLAIGLSAPKR
jgi:hypothetical protein